MPTLLELDTATKDSVAIIAQPAATPLDRARELNHYLRSAAGRRVTYNPGRSTDAQGTWNARMGDCLSYAHLFNALGRHLRIPLNYIRYRAAVSVEERDGHLLVVSHVASYYSDGQSSAVIELSGRAPSFWGTDYQVIGDDEAWALHYTNEAVQLLNQGDIVLAEAKLKFLLQNVPSVTEVPINLSALLLRQRRFIEAYNVTQDALKHFSSSVPLLLNASVAAKALQKNAEGDALLALAQAPLTDPFAALMRGIGLFEQGDILGAERLFSSAHRKAPKSMVLFAWQVRAQLKLGHTEQALASYLKMRTEGPTHPLVRAVERELTAARVEQQPAPALSLQPAELR